MTQRTHKILLVEPDAAMLELIVASLARRFDANITCVPDAESCLDTEMLDPHDLVITATDLPGTPGLRLAEQLLTLSQRPVILIADDPTADEAIQAVRLGVRDMFRKPFPVADLLDAADRALAGSDLRRQRAVRYRRMREMVRRAIRERRDLNRRIELICRDVVLAQRRLVRRVLEIETTASHFHPQN